MSVPGALSCFCGARRVAVEAAVSDGEARAAGEDMMEAVADST